MLLPIKNFGMFCAFGSHLIPFFMGLYIIDSFVRFFRKDFK